MAKHDHGYKLLFSHASVVADVIRGFVKEDWVKEVDFETLERVEGSFVSDGLLARETDMLWKVKWRGQELYIFILLEFQSKIDRFMAVKNMTYLGLIYQHMIKQKLFTPSGKLPPVFILVLYNGLRPWHGALDIADLIEAVPGGLEAYRPHLRFALLDEARVPEMELESERNIAAALFRLEKSRDVETLRREIGRMTAAPGLDPSVKAAVYTWLTRVLVPGRFPEQSIAEAQSLEEVQTMLAERVKEWTREWKEEGRQEGRQEGRMEGRMEGARAFQDFLLAEMVERFGPVPRTIRHRVKEIQDLEELKTLGKRLLAATSLDDLGLRSPVKAGCPGRQPAAVTTALFLSPLTPSAGCIMPAITGNLCRSPSCSEEDICETEWSSPRWP